jgi:hypothetical protein
VWAYSLLTEEINQFIIITGEAPPSPTLWHYLPVLELHALHLIPCKETLTSADFARLFIDRYIPLHGIPNLIISDRDPKFISAFWLTVKAHLGLKHSMSMTDHPQTDGLQECMFRRTNQLLRTLVNT